MSATTYPCRSDSKNLSVYGFALRTSGPVTSSVGRRFSSAFAEVMDPVLNSTTRGREVGSSTSGATFDAVKKWLSPDSTTVLRVSAAARRSRISSRSAP